MTFSSRLIASMLVLAVAVPLGASAPAVAADDTVATTSLGRLGRADLPNGSPGLLGTTANQDFHGTPVKDQFLGAAVLQDEGLDDTWAHGGELGAWLAPEHDRPAATFRPQLSLNQSLLFESVYDGGPTVGPGDRAGFSFAAVPYNAPVPWGRERGTATGRLEWSATSLTQQTSSTFGGTTGHLETFMYRADIVATGGDVDARTQSVSLPPLVLDLPRSYEPGTRYVGIAGVTTPYTTYFRSFGTVLLPEAGKMILNATIDGYIPEGRTVTLPNGSTVNEWHLPLTGVIGFATEGAGEPSASFGVPMGGVAKDMATNELVSLGAGESLLATSAGASAIAAEEPAPAQSNSLFLDDAAASSRIDRDATDPIDLDLSSGFSLTVHPDYDGTGFLALEDVRSERLRKNYADLVTVPAVRVSGNDVLLTRDKLIGLRAIPFRNGGGIRLTPSASFRDGGFNQSAATSMRIYRGGFLLDALYEAGDGIIVNVQHQLFHQGVPSGGRLNTNVTALALDGRLLDVYPIATAVASGGPPVANNEPLTVETSFSSHRTVELGAQRIHGTFRDGAGSRRGGATAVLRAPAPLLGRTPDPSVELAGAPVAVHMTPPAAFTLGRNMLAILTFGLVKGSDPESSPPALGDACHGVQITDHAVPDAPPSHDIKATWFEADRANIYVSMQIADVPATTSTVPVRYATYLWLEHEQYIVEALQQNGQWVFQTGIPAVSWRAPVEGDVVSGPNGIVRVAVPRYFFDVADGDWLRDTATHSFVTGNRPVDSAPQGSTLTFGLGDDYRVAPCVEEELPELLDTTLELASIEPAQYSDEFTVSGLLRDEAGAPLARRMIDLTVTAVDGPGDQDAALRRTVGTEDDGTFVWTALAGMEPGDYEVTAAFAGEDDAYVPSTATSRLVVLREDSALDLNVEGRGAHRTLDAVLSDADDLSPVAGRELAFYADGVLLGHGVTDESGRVIFELPPRYRGGHHDYEAVFPGDTYYVGVVAAAST